MMNLLINLLIKLLITFTILKKINSSAYHSCKKVKKFEVNRLREGYILDSITSVDFQEIAERGGKVIENYEGVV